MTAHKEFLKYVKTYRPDEPLVVEGESDTDFFCLLQGTVGIWKGDPNAEDERVKIGDISEKGAYFGEMSCLLEEARTASIVAVDHVKALKFPGSMLEEMMLKQPKLGIKICTALANRLKGTTANQKNIVIQRNELREDATSQFLYARNQFQKVFIILSAIQAQLNHPNLKALIEYMSHDKLQGHRKLRVSSDFFDDIPQQLVEPVKKAFSNILS